MWKGRKMGTHQYDSDRSTRFTRRSLRLKTHNYAWTGTYFVTIRAREHEPLFEIPELRTILVDMWHALPQRFPGLTLDEFVVMPDHVHFIVFLEGNVEKAASLGRVVGTYKSLTTLAWLRHIEAAKMERSGRFWQHNYYEHIIRDAEELEKIRQYIRDNPSKPGKFDTNGQGQMGM